MPNVVAKKIGANVRRARRQAGMSQQQLAEKLGIGVMAVSRIERGVTKEVTVQRVCEIAEALDVTVTELVVCE